MRIIESHKTNGCNEAIAIEADERDPDNGNTSHVYHLRWNIERDGKPFEVDQLIQFQHGPIKEVGVNGITNEALLALLIDRMEGFQSGQYRCHDNELALDHLQYTRLILHKRTMDRVARNVEGTNQA